MDAVVTHETSCPITRAIYQSGFLNYERGLYDLLDKGAQEVAALIGGYESQFSFQRSGVSATHAKPTKNSQVVCVDVGGTNVRVSVRRVDQEGNVTWHPLFNQPHAELCNNTATPFPQFAAKLAQIVAEKMKILDQASFEKNAVVITWSNSFEPEQLGSDAPIKGVSGVASKVKELYNKGELFLDGIKDGTPIGDILRSAFRDSGVPMDTFVLGNDTVFTLKAGLDVHAGLIASTGTNGTLVINGEVINGETGGGFKVPASMLGIPDQQFGEEVSVQDIVAGGFLPKVYQRYLKEFAGRCVSGLRELDHKHEIFTKLVKAEGITGLADGDRNRFRRYAPFDTDGFSDQTWDSLTLVATALTNRAADLSAVLALTSLANRFGANERGPHAIGVDSSMARGSAQFQARFRESVARLAFPHVVEIQLLEPDGDISVPTRGAAATADTIWASTLAA